MAGLDTFLSDPMENKGLALFNVAQLMADSQCATDQDADYIKATVAHEYLHNWSGQG